ncbi:MAG: hypothetical protein U0L60_03350, partial [Ruminococcus sp.]|nr:hypothetical protein [Ruminococcus sp.]
NSQSRRDQLGLTPANKGSRKTLPPTKAPSDTAAVFGGYCYVAAVSALRIRKTAKSKTALQATARRLFALRLGNACFFLVNLCTSCAFVCNFPRFFGYSEGLLTNIHHRKEDFSFEQHET